MVGQRARQAVRWLQSINKQNLFTFSFFWISGIYEYHQFDNWMAAAGFMDYLQHGPGVSIARAVQPGWDTVRVLKESLFYRPLAPRPQLLAPLHVDCETGGAGCPEFPVFRLWVTLDPVPRGRGVVFQVELETKVMRRFVERAPNRAFPWWKA